MNQFTKLAKMICQIEGKKKQLDIAQVKEVLKILIDNICDCYQLGIDLDYFASDNEIGKVFLEMVVNKITDPFIQKRLAKNKNKRKK